MRKDETTETSADAAPDRRRRRASTEEANPKRLVIFCDGTWNDLRMPHLTNVARLAKCVKPTGGLDVGSERSVEVPQVVYYDEGVGVSDGVSRLADALVRIEGGALGRGLDVKIEKAYRFVVLNYNPGDEIFIFGFSRGAYTARSLCGLIRNCGVLRRTKFECTPQAMALYRSGESPSSDVSQKFRRDNSHPVIAGSEDYTDEDRRIIDAYRKNKGLNPELQIVPPEIRRRGFHIRYLGVWDTVGSLGVPVKFKLLHDLTSRKYLFHDETASSLIESLRHAVALDEDRASFDSTPVGNVHELNQLWAAAEPDLQVDHPQGSGFVSYPDRPYQQRWFPGDHGAVGGGNAELGLSSAALLWVAEGATSAGLELDQTSGSELAAAALVAQPCANWRINKDGSARPPNAKDLIGEVSGYKRRLGPMTLDEIHEGARERWRRDPTYRPSGMLRFRGMPELEEAKATSARLISTVNVRARLRWVDTGVDVEPGQTLALNAKGLWFDFYIPCSANGYAAGLFYRLRRLPRVVDDQRYFRLMGRIGDAAGPPRIDTPLDPGTPNGTFRIGTKADYRVLRAGRLYVFANDGPGQYGNNWGRIRLTIRR